MGGLAKLLVFLVLAIGGIAHAAQESDNQLVCRAKIFRAQLDYEFRFHTNFEFIFPLKQFCDVPGEMDAEIRFQPVGDPVVEPAVLADRVVWSLDTQDCRKGEMFLAHDVWTGVGQYRATWRFRDALGRSCQGSDEFAVSRSRKDRDIDLNLPPGTLVDTPIDLFRPEPRTERPEVASPHRLKVFINLDVLTSPTTIRAVVHGGLRWKRATLVRTRAMHLRPHLAVLRQLAHSEWFNEFSIVVFSFEEQVVLARQDYRDEVDFSLLGKFIDDLSPYTVKLGQLARGSEMSFFGSLLATELLADSSPDAVVFIGHDIEDVLYGKRISDRVLDRLDGLGAAFTFMNTGRLSPWRGTMGSLVRALGGTVKNLRKPSEVLKVVDAFERSAIESRPH